MFAIYTLAWTPFMQPRALRTPGEHLQAIRAQVWHTYPGRAREVIHLQAALLY